MLLNFIYVLLPCTYFINIVYLSKIIVSSSYFLCNCLLFHGVLTAGARDLSFDD